MIVSYSDSKIDRLGTDVISQEEFRAAIESRFDIEMTDEQFRVLMDQVPLTDEGDVKYAEFMSQFDTRSARAPQQPLLSTQKLMQFRPLQRRDEEFVQHVSPKRSRCQAQQPGLQPASPG